MNIVVCVLLFFVITSLIFFENISADNDAEDLNFSQGKRYVYLFENPGSDFFYGVYVINETDAFWKGVTVDVYNDSEQLVGFMLYKTNLSLYLSGLVEVEDVLNDNIIYYRFDSPGSLTSFINSVPIIYNKEAYDFNFENLMETGSAEDMWGGMEIDLKLETDNIFMGYNAYKLTAGDSNFYGLYYMSDNEPYLLIDWDSFIQGKQITSISLQSVDDILFSESEYNDFVNYSREEASKLKDNTFDDSKTDTSENNDDKGIPGFEILLLIFSVIVILFIRRKQNL